MTAKIGKIKLKSIVFLVLLLFLSGPSWSQFNSNKMACWPQEWWIGMAYNKVQVLIKGNNISTAIAAVSHSGVSISNQYGAKSKDFLFVEIEIRENASAGMFAIRLTRNNTPVGTVNFTLHNRSYNYTPATITGADAIYQIVPDRFVNGNPDNDHLNGLFEKADRSNPSGVHGGDIQGISNAMNYIKDLGINTVELTPLYESNQLILSYEKFSPTSHFDVDKRLGALSEIKNTIQQFRNNQIKVIITQVLHKVGNQHAIFRSPPDPDWVFSRDLLALQKPTPMVFADPYAAQEDVERHSKIWESFDRPALNHQNKELKRYLIQHVLWWVETFQPDGIKIDKTHLCHPELLAQLTQILLDEYPKLNILAAPEVENMALNAYWKKGGNEKFRFTHITDAPLKAAVNDAFAEYSDTHEALFPIYRTLASDQIYNNAIDQLILNGDNHRSTRLYSLAEKDLALFRIYMGFLLTTRGIPSFLYGTEVLLDGYAPEGNGFVRKDFPGGWAGDASSAFNQSTLTREQREAWQFTSTLLNWRKNNPDVMQGGMIQLEPFEDVYAYIRVGQSKKLLVIINNNSSSPRRLEGAKFQYSIDPTSRVTNIINGEVSNGLGNLILGHKSILILELTAP